MQRFVALCLLALLVVTSSVVAAQQPHDELTRRFEEAFFAWDSGDYIDGIEGFIEILNAPGGERFFEQIALTTGELYVTEEVAADGRSIRMSPDGAFAAYETRGEDGVTTHVRRLNGAGQTLDIDGTGLIFAPTSDRVAYLAVTETDELVAARAQLEATDPEDRDAMREARQRASELELAATHIEITDLTSLGSAGTALDMGNFSEAGMAFSSDGTELFVAGGWEGTTDANDLIAIRLDEAGANPRNVTDFAGFKANPVAIAGGEYVLYTIPRVSPVPQPGAGGGRFGGARGGRGGRGAGGPANERFALVDLMSGATWDFEGNSPVVSADGSTIAFAANADGDTVFSVMEVTVNPQPREIFRTANTVGTFEISPSGDRLVTQMRLREDWELFLVDTTAEDTPGSPTAAAAVGEATRLTIEIQHDLAARFLTDDVVLAAIGEGRHRRSYLYDVNTLERTRLFHNNTVRTIAPEYEWQQSADGSKVLIGSERDGDTVSPERAVYLVDLEKKISKADLLARLETGLAGERTLRAHGRLMFSPIANDVRAAVADVSMSRLYKYQKDLFDFGSKNITRQGNAAARQYLYDTYAGFGYEPALQWFEPQPRGASEPIRTANVLAKLEGTENPELIYVVSSHFDSTARGPGADDNTSGTVMLLETARVLADHPLPYTVIFASFTGEESGLLGSREFVRQAVENGDRVMGALNNDMMGWANDHHIDNTIRYSNPGIRDLQHAAAMLFSDLITYDALYYKSTDAAAYYEAYGDIVGGIGSYPVLGNPHYHQTHDVLETMNHEQIRETTKTNVASIMLLASSPSRLNGLHMASRDGDTVELDWERSPENTVFQYVIRVRRPEQEFEEYVVDYPGARMENIPDGTLISVKAVSTRGVRGWDWAHVTVGQ